MSHADPPLDFLSLPAREYPSDDDLAQNPVQPALETLFSEFAQRHRSLSPSTQSSPRSARHQTRFNLRYAAKPSMVDLRALEYISDYDSHLMCPICHVPFIDPVVLDCDHTFCASCYDEFRRGASTSEPSQCPSCRTYILSSPRKASRLIYNMCNDIKVQCPNEECTTLLARGYVERHVTKECLEQQLICPDAKCQKQTKRKNYVPGQCIHETHIECDCGAIIELGRGEWLKHKDELCPNTSTKCERCGARLSMKEYLSRNREHICSADSTNVRCPGVEFGCADEVAMDDLSQHVSICLLARLAPHLKAQSRLLHSLQDQLASSKLRNETLEVEVERLNHSLNTQIKIQSDVPTASNASDFPHEDREVDHDIEEIPRDTIPSAASAIHHRDLLLPAHLRDLTPSPDLFASQNSNLNNNAQANNLFSAQNHLLAMHESLRHTVSGIESDVNGLHSALSELDARTSMQLLNETLRIKEDLAHTNAALFSNRSQVQWLLNRERIGREQAIMRERERERGRMGTATIPTGQNSTQRTVNTANGMQRQVSHDGTVPRQPGVPSPGGGGTQHQYESFPFQNTSGSGPSSAATSPLFTSIGMAGGSAGSTRRPSIRGGSQERVKL